MKERLKGNLRPLYWVFRRIVEGEHTMQMLAFCKKMYFAQFGEDMLLDQYFEGRDEGFYIDVGAYHPYNVSNTCVFYKRGWRGINIEPNPMSFKNFLKHRPRDINLNVAVAAEEGEVAFECAEEKSGIPDEHWLFRDRGLRSQRVQVRTLPLRAILAAHLPSGSGVDFMSIDCEGRDAEV